MIVEEYMWGSLQAADGDVGGALGGSLRQEAMNCQSFGGASQVNGHWETRQERRLMTKSEVCMWLGLWGYKS